MPTFHYIILSLLVFLFIGSGDGNNVQSVKSDAGCRTIGVKESNKYRPGTSINVGLQFSTVFNKVPRILVSVGFGTSSENQNDVPDSYEKMPIMPPTYSQMYCPQTFTAIVTDKETTRFAVGVSKQLAISSSTIMSSESICFQPLAWPTSLRVCWFAWEKDMWHTTEPQTIREGTIYHLYMSSTRVKYNVVFTDKDKKVSPFASHQELNIQVTLHAVGGLTDPLSYSVSNVDENGFTIHVGLAGGNPPTGGPSPANEIWVDYLVQASKNMTKKTLVATEPRAGFYDIIFYRNVCDDTKIHTSLEDSITGIWVLFEDCTAFPSAQRMKLISHHYDKVSRCEIFEYALSIPNGHNKLKISFSNYPWCEFLFFYTLL